MLTLLLVQLAMGFDPNAQRAVEVIITNRIALEKDRAAINGALTMLERIAAALTPPPTETETTIPTPTATRTEAPATAAPE